MITEQQEFWKAEYSRAYIQKNSNFNLAGGIKCWAKMLERAEHIGSVLECGCNIGRNIDFLNHVLPGSTKSIIEISPDAFQIVSGRFQLEHAFNGTILESSFPVKFDLVFTVGVLIHIHPDDLLANMKKIHDCSSRYILIGEYFNRTPVMLEYQGQRNKLFKRDFGKTFMENFSVKLIDYGFLWGKLYDEAGFDDITYWLFEKQGHETSL